MRLVYTGGESSNYEITLFSDQGEAHSKKVEDACRKYGVLKKSTGGYTPQHNAFAERWFRTISEMSTCQMLQYDMPEAYWEDSRRMATFIYNRVPPVRLIPGEDWEPPIKKQYPTRETMDLTKLQPFGIKCWVYQKKPKRDRLYAGKSDKKERSIEGVLVGYCDSRGPLHVKVHFPSLSKSEWYPEELVEFADALHEMKMVYEKPAAKDMGEKPEEYFKPLVGTRHIDPDDGLQYEVTEVKTNQRKQIVAYRQRYYKGQYEGNVDGPYHVADIYSYTKINLDALMELTVENQGVSPMARNAEKYSRRENLAGDTVRGRSRPHQDENTLTTKSSSNRAPSSTVSEKAGPRRQSSRESKKPELYEPPSRKAYYVNTMLTAMAASVAAGDSFPILATTELKRESLVPTPELLAKDDYEPSHRKYMQQCARKQEWEVGEKEELESIAKNEVWTKVPLPAGSKVIPLE